MFLGPIVKSLWRLSPDNQFSVLSTAVTALCEAWTSNILKDRIRFRFLYEKLRLTSAFNAPTYYS